ncbi:AraC family transcriptional regulator [Sulfuricurvum sp.]|uniref:helix-turn-helix domain-containing protein n=1 Tax=Sulfuricurvum sp. TaxID=2025608 RepID=UPI002E2F247E|nr:AraC family transcriptional regulator [Sulfuricurvum sp.]HEX5330779.1 AraC family transcriptional regulator [Sulfuricurvum sp.]
MNIIWHESPFIDSIFHVPVEMYQIEQDFFFRGSPSVHEHIILNQNCAIITFHLNNQVYEFDGSVVCGKFTHPPSIKIVLKNRDKKLTVIRLNAYGIFKHKNIPISSMVNNITPGSKISIDLSDDMEIDHSLRWVEKMVNNDKDQKAYQITRDIIQYIDTNFPYLPSRMTKAVAKEFGLSESTVLRYFKKYIGMSLSTYIVTLRRKKMVESVCNNTYDSMRIRENGYYDQSHFLNDFKRLYGVPLKQYFNEMQTMKDKAPDFIRFMYQNELEKAV